MFADAAKVSNSTDPDPDTWKEVTNEGRILWRTPSNNNGAWYHGSAERVVNRHQGKGMVVFADGHAKAFSAKQLGLADDIRVGDPSAMWDLE